MPGAWFLIVNQAEKETPDLTASGAQIKRKKLLMWHPDFASFASDKSSTFMSENHASSSFYGTDNMRQQKSL